MKPIGKRNVQFILSTRIFIKQSAKLIAMLSMTAGAQQALRRTMEIYSSTTRFAFACNQSNKIIEPLQSRCAILRYARLTDGQVVKRIMQICEAEKVEHSDDGIAALVFSAEGDMRQAINNLQSTWTGSGFVSGDNVFKVVDSPHPIKVQAMIKAAYESKIDAALDTLKELWSVRSLSSSRLPFIDFLVVPKSLLSVKCLILYACRLSV